MRRYRVVHTTGFDYEAEVVASYNEARMTPTRTENQTVFSTKLEISASGSTHEYVDYFNTRTVAFEVLEPHTSLKITATSVIELRPNAVTEERFLGWQELAEKSKTSIELVDALTQTQRTEPPKEVTKLAVDLATKLSPNETALAICKHVFGVMKYKAGQSGVDSIAAEAWISKFGVCQDYAHIVLGALRAANIPARYVSGYLHPHLEPKLGETVLGESHAWVEWFVGRWVQYDPTNDIAVTDRHIFVGYGRDYHDVSPLRGVFAGSNETKLNVEVQITREA